MTCETKVRLRQHVAEAKLAIEDSTTVEAHKEKADFLLTAEVNVFEHEQTCVVCRPLGPLPEDPRV
jgi:hypothetical protein